MKVIGLIPFKNEEHFLPTYLSNVKPICDEIIAVDDHSTDNSRKIMEDAGVIVKGYEDTEKLINDDIFDNERDLNPPSFNPSLLNVDGEIIEGRNSIGATIPADLSGFPAISIPFGFSNKGLPIGVQLIGKYAEDSNLLGLSLCFESHTKGINNYPYD